MPPHTWAVGWKGTGHPVWAFPLRKQSYLLGSTEESPMTGLKVVLGAISSKLDTAACMGESWDLPKRTAFSLKPVLRRGDQDRVLSTKDANFPLTPIPTPTDERWDAKIPRNTTRPRINAASSSPPHSFNSQPLLPQTDKTPSIWPQNRERTQRKNKEKGEENTEKEEKGGEKKRKIKF